MSGDQSSRIPWEVASFIVDLPLKIQLQKTEEWIFDREYDVSRS